MRVSLSQDLGGRIRLLWQRLNDREERKLVVGDRSSFNSKGAIVLIIERHSSYIVELGGEKKKKLPLRR